MPTNLNPFRSQAKGKCSTGKKFRGLAVLKLSNFLKVVLTTETNVRARAQFRGERQPQFLKDDFSSRTKP